jgi:hypothetical protein
MMMPADNKVVFSRSVQNPDNGELETLKLKGNNGSISAIFLAQRSRTCCERSITFDHQNMQVGTQASTKQTQAAIGMAILLQNVGLRKCDRTFTQSPTNQRLDKNVSVGTLSS